MTEQSISVAGWTLYEKINDLEGPWISVTELATHLGYHESADLLKVYDQHATSFTEGQDTCAVQLQISGEIRSERLFNERGTFRLLHYLTTSKAPEVLAEILEVLLSYRHGKENCLRKARDILGIIAYQARLISQLAEEMRKDRDIIAELQSQLANYEAATRAKTDRPATGLVERTATGFADARAKVKSYPDKPPSRLHTKLRAAAAPDTRKKTLRKDLISAIIERRDSEP